MRGTQHRERCVESLTGLGPAPYVHETLQVSPAERNVVRVVGGRPRSPPSSVPTRPGVPDPPPRGPKAARARHAGLVARAPSSEDSEGEGEEKRIRVIVRKRPTSRSESAAAERGEETDVVHDCRRLFEIEIEIECWKLLDPLNGRSPVKCLEDSRGKVHFPRD